MKCSSRNAHPQTAFASTKIVITTRTISTSRLFIIQSNKQIQLVTFYNLLKCLFLTFRRRTLHFHLTKIIINKFVNSIQHTATDIVILSVGFNSTDSYDKSMKTEENSRNIYNIRYEPGINRYKTIHPFNVSIRYKTTLKCNSTT